MSSRSEKSKSSYSAETKVVVILGIKVAGTAVGARHVRCCSEW